jgi:hypothetical protein
MSSGAALDTVEAATADYPPLAKGMKDESILEKQDVLTSSSEEIVGPNGELYPTADEWKTLRRVYGKVNYMIYVIGLVEMCERFAYYGTTAVCMCQLLILTIGPADLIQLSTSSSKSSRKADHSHLLVQEEHITRPVHLAWDSGLRRVWFSSTSSSHTSRPWLVGPLTLQLSITSIV